jgi:predicted aldo/keto reductase-like oxidoreductase
MAALPHLANPQATLEPILARLEHEMERTVGRHWMDHWTTGLPRMEQVPGEVHLYHILRLHSLARAYDMVGYGKMRYNLLGNGGHWFPGNKVDKMEWAKLPDVLKESPVAAEIPAKLREAHELLNDQPRKRLSES